MVEEAQPTRQDGQWGQLAASVEESSGLCANPSESIIELPPRLAARVKKMMVAGVEEAHITLALSITQAQVRYVGNLVVAVDDAEAIGVDANELAADIERNGDITFSEVARLKQASRTTDVYAEEDDITRVRQKVLAHVEIMVDSGMVRTLGEGIQAWKVLDGSQRNTKAAVSTSKLAPQQTQGSGDSVTHLTPITVNYTGITVQRADADKPAVIDAETSAVVGLRAGDSVVELDNVTPDTVDTMAAIEFDDADRANSSSIALPSSSLDNYSHPVKPEDDAAALQSAGLEIAELINDAEQASHEARSVSRVTVLEDEDDESVYPLDSNEVGAEEAQALDVFKEITHGG